jgi:F420H(2)-dependent quinone reductase
MGPESPLYDRRMGLLTPLAVRLGAIPWLPRFLPQIVWLDTRLQRLTRGRLSLADLAGLPNLMLTVPGRRSGKPRSTPLLCVPDGTHYLVAGSYFGGPKEPIWTGSAESQPELSPSTPAGRRSRSMTPH